MSEGRKGKERGREERRVEGKVRRKETGMNSGRVKEREAN